MPQRQNIIIHASEPEELADRVRQTHSGIEVHTCDTYEALPSMIESLKPEVVFSIRFAGTPGFPTAPLLGKNGPKWISIGGSGVDHLGEWDTDKTTVTNSSGVAADMMAQYIMGGLLHFSLDLADLRKDQNAKRWCGKTMTSIAGKTMLIVGLGSTGKAVAAKAKAFGLNVIGVKANPIPQENVDEVHGTNDIANLWGKADFVVLTVPLLDTTRGLVEKSAFSAIKDGCVIADVSRGGVMVEKDLVAALQSGKVRGAVLDVFETEPLPEDNPLWEMEEVLISPHCSSVFHGWERASINMFCENLGRWLNNEPLHNIVDPKRGY